MGQHIFITDDNQTETVAHLLGFDAKPSPEWAIQRPDGQYWIGSTRNPADGRRVFKFGPTQPVTFISPESAQCYVDQMQRSTIYRQPFTDCKVVQVQPMAEAGDHVVCACGQMHEADYCPTQHGHGVVL